MITENDFVLINRVLYPVIYIDKNKVIVEGNTDPFDIQSLCWTGKYRMGRFVFTPKSNFKKR